MTLKPIASTAFAVLLAFGFVASEAQAGKKKNLAIGIAIGAGVVAFAAAASAANAHRGRSHYAYNHGIGDRDNALAACLHRADLYVYNRKGGDGIELRKVKSIKRWGHNGYKVRVKFFSYGPWGREKSNAKCWVKHDRVTKMKFKF